MKFDFDVTGPNGEELTIFNVEKFSEITLHMLLYYPNKDINDFLFTSEDTDVVFLSISDVEDFLTNINKVDCPQAYERICSRESRIFSSEEFTKIYMGTYVDEREFAEDYLQGSIPDHLMPYYDFEEWYNYSCYTSVKLLDGNVAIYIEQG